MSERPQFEFEPGERFGSYEIVRALGKGAFGVVYEALRLPLKKRVALKILLEQHSTRADIAERFVREAQIVAQLEHPHVVSVFDIGLDAASPYIAMEFLEGESLAEKLERERPLAVQAALEILLPVASALVAVHAKGIIHRDLKPANIFLARTAIGTLQPRLLDFGVAKVRDAEHALTNTHAMIGTPHYMSPEQVREAKDITGASDQWALAVVLYECLTGSTPFQRPSLYEVLAAITNEPIAPASTLNARIPEALDAVLAKALERRPDHRYGSMRAFAAALLPFAAPNVREQWADFFALHEETPTAPPDPPPETTAAPFVPKTIDPSTMTSAANPAPKQPPRRSWIAVVVGVLVLVSVGAVVSRSSASVTASPIVPVTVHSASRTTTVDVVTPDAVEAPVHVTTALPTPTPTEVPAPPPNVAPHRTHRPGRNANTPPTTPTPTTSAAPRNPANCPNGICAVD